MRTFKIEGAGEKWFVIEVVTSKNFGPFDSKDKAFCYCDGLKEGYGMCTEDFSEAFIRSQRYFTEGLDPNDAAGGANPLASASDEKDSRSVEEGTELACKHNQLRS